MDAQDDPDVMARFVQYARCAEDMGWYSNRLCCSLIPGTVTNTCVNSLRHSRMFLRPSAWSILLFSINSRIFSPLVGYYLVRAAIARRYINDCRRASLYNVTFRKLPEERKALVVALKDIEPGEEIFVDYGR